MKTINELLDAAKRAKDIETDSGLAHSLGLHRAAVSTWRHGKNLPDAVACGKLADMAGLPLPRVLGLVGELRAISRDEKAVWRRLASAACLVLALGQAGWAKATSPGEGWTSHNVYNGRRWLRFLRIGGALRAAA